MSSKAKMKHKKLLQVNMCSVREHHSHDVDNEIFKLSAQNFKFKQSVKHVSQSEHIHSM